MTAPVIDQTLSDEPGGVIEEVRELLTEIVSDTDLLQMLLVELREAHGDFILDQVAALLPASLTRSYWDFCEDQGLLP